MSSSQSLKNKRFLITGSAQGLGYKLAVKMNQLGASLILMDKQVDKLKTLEAELSSNPRGTNLTLGLDFLGATYDDYVSVSEIVKNKFGAIDGIIFNASSLGSLSPLTHYEPLTWAKTFQVNVHSNFLMYKTLHSLLDQSRDTIILFVLAPEIENCKPNWGAYFVTKKTQKAMLELIASENNETLIKTYGIIPTPMNTDLRRQAYPGKNNSSLPSSEKNIELILSLILNPKDFKNGQTVKVTR
ncbi:SDR family NAD(P)-dependent oxidoreductase [Pseudomonadota bacterium]|nr:SDR family NAD(P)-dependent oxidoreductase [Pseudomonadota bacterium]